MKQFFFRLDFEMEQVWTVTADGLYIFSPELTRIIFLKIINTFYIAHSLFQFVRMFT